MTPLITMLEQADCGSRELDAEIALAIDWKLPIHKSTTFAVAVQHYPEQKLAYAKDFKVPHFSTSIDAALSALPEGHRLDMLKCRRYNGEEWEADIECHASRGPGGWALGKTAALALITAILKATREAGE